MKTKFFLSVLMLLSLSAISQTKFEKGYYISNTNEKVEGYIKNMDWRNNPVSFEFKADENAEIQVIGIDYAKTFTIAQTSSYTRADVDIERSSNKLQYMGKIKEPQYRNERLFLKQIVSGTANLYKFEENGLEKFFYSVNGSAIKQLIYIQYINTAAVEYNEVSANDFFRRQLWMDVKCETTTQRNIKSTEYNTLDLTKYFENYNSCKGDKAVSEIVAKKVKQNFKASVMYNNGVMNVENTNSNYSPEFKNSSVGFGFEYELVLPFNNNKWAIAIEPSYNTFKDSQTLPYSFGSTAESKTDIKFFQIPLAIRHYFFLTDNSKIFINAIGNIRVIGNKNKIEHAYYSDLNYTETSFSFAFGIGYNYRKISGEVRYFPSSNVSNHSNIPINFGNTSFILRYELFGRK
nr:hypothetical protein [uncultured Flavobacterium sp.]